MLLCNSIHISGLIALYGVIPVKKKKKKKKEERYELNEYE